MLIPASMKKKRALADLVSLSALFRLEFEWKPRGTPSPDATKTCACPASPRPKTLDRKSASKTQGGAEDLPFLLVSQTSL